MQRFLRVIFIFIILSSIAFAQLDLKRDDFVGTDNRNWWWYDNGPSTPMPAVSDGFVLFSLVDPDTSYDPFCDAALWDGYPPLGGPYQYCTITLRVKALNPHKLGSRGWGLWYTEPYPDLQRQAWFMRELDSTGTGYTGLNWWRAETSNGRTEATHHFTDLDTLTNIVDDQKWHVYKIIRDTTYIAMLVDRDTVLYVTQDLPVEDMAFHIWVDNIVYEHVDPDIINIHKRQWKGKNEIVLDYVQIETPNTQLDKSQNPTGILLLRQVPNAIYTDTLLSPWKNYEFNSPGGNIVTLATARVEQYLDAQNNPISGDDDLRIVIDGNDYGWNTATSFNADAAGTGAKTLVFQQSASAGLKSIQLYGETSPMLYDVTVLGSSSGGIVFNQEYNETKSAVSDSLWKTISFQTNGGQIAVYVSGSADEDPNPTNYGYQYSDFDDNADDDLRIQIDDTDYGYYTENSFWGNRLFGEPKSVLILTNLASGTHALRLYAQNTPTLYRVLIYGESDDSSLPVSLVSFDVTSDGKNNYLKWVTASEINNLGFNLYKAVASGGMQVPDRLVYVKINDSMIPGAGTSSETHEYQYRDEGIEPENTYWYYLEDVDYSGVKTQYDTIKIVPAINTMPDQVTLSKNYPNPFNNGTVFKITLAKEKRIEVKIIDTGGKIVKRIADAVFKPGVYEMRWQGKTDTDINTTSGVYFIVLSSEDGIIRAQKIVLIK